MIKQVVTMIKKISELTHEDVFTFQEKDEKALRRIGIKTSRTLLKLPYFVMLSDFIIPVRLEHINACTRVFKATDRFLPNGKKAIIACCGDLEVILFDD